MLACALTLPIGSCGELSGTVVPLPRSAALQILYNMPGKADLMDIPLQGTTAHRNVDKTDAGVVWTYSFYNKPICRLTVHIKEETENSSVVWTELEEVGGDPPNKMCQAALIAGNESVAATIAGRAADREHVTKAVDALSL